MIQEKTKLQNHEDKLNVEAEERKWMEWDWMFRPGTFFLKLAAKFNRLFQSDDVTKFSIFDSVKLQVVVDL